MSTEPTIVVLAKAPVPGRVKTRLCPPLSPEDAARLAAAALADTMATVARVPGTRRLLALDGEADFEIPPPFEIVPQCAGDLAARIDGALDTGTGPTLLIGMDTPQLGVVLLRAAVAALTDHDAVLGPARDGGFWAIGRARPGPPLCTGVAMSTPETGARVRSRLDALGMRTAILPTLRDVDELADAVAVAALAPRGRFARAFAALDPARVA